eukprot:scaffold11234_cov57-Phaeocystis_antarctica.AAC.6
MTTRPKASMAKSPLARQCPSARLLCRLKARAWRLRRGSALPGRGRPTRRPATLPVGANRSQIPPIPTAFDRASRKRP